MPGSRPSDSSRKSRWSPAKKAEARRTTTPRPSTGGAAGRGERGPAGERGRYQGRDDRGQFQPREQRGGRPRQGDGGFQGRDGRDGVRGRDDRGGYPRRDDRTGYQGRDDRSGYRGRDDRSYQGRDDRSGQRGRDDRGGYPRRDDRGGFPGREERGGHPRRDDRGGYQSRDERGGFQNRADRGGYQGREDRGGYQRRDERGGFQGREDRGGYQRRDERGGFQGREDRGGYQRRDERGGFQGREDRGGYQRRDERGGFQGREDRGGYQRRDERGGFQGRDDRGGYQRRDERGGDRGGYPRRDDRDDRYARRDATSADAPRRERPTHHRTFDNAPTTRLGHQQERPPRETYVTPEAADPAAQPVSGDADVSAATEPASITPAEGAAVAQETTTSADAAATTDAPGTLADDGAPAENGFAALGVPDALVQRLARDGITTPFPIQRATLPDALAGRDVLGRGRTGSGKTLAFGLAALARLEGGRPKPNRPRAMILVPTRELASQVSDALQPLVHVLGLRHKLVAGGMPYPPQFDALERGVDILIATPGRMNDLVDRGAAILDEVEIAVLDEADHMADMGFLPEVTALLDLVPAGGQRLLFSATLDNGIDELVERYLVDPVTHSTDDATASVTTMAHHILLVEPAHKKIITAEVANRTGRTVVFVRTKLGADRIAMQLREAGVFAAALHGGLNQNARNRVLAGFKDGTLPVLVATDVAARGIHVDDVSVVLQVDPPADHKDYLHRAGRTARAGEAGTVVTLALPHQKRMMERIAREAGLDTEPVRVRAGDSTILAATGARRPSGDPIPEERLRRLTDPPRRPSRPSYGKGRSSGPRHGRGYAGGHGRHGGRSGGWESRRDG